MVEIVLHGKLGRDFGRVWNMDVLSPAEAVHAIDTMRKGFRKAIMALDGAGYVFKVNSDRHEHTDEDVSLGLQNTKRIDIIPLLRGASAGVRFVVGAVLVAAVVAGFIVNPIGATAALSIGSSLMLGAVTEWLTPTQKSSNDSKNSQSWGLSGPTNTVDQGYPVPVIYGEVLTGGYTVSAGITANQVSASGSSVPAISLSGKTDFNINTGGYGIGYGGQAITKTVRISLSVSTLNFSEPFTYVWSYTGFALATARRLVSSNTATVILELDYSSAIPNAYIKDTGNLSLNFTGVDSSGNTSSVPVVVPLTANKAITVTVNNYQWGGYGNS